MSAWIKMIPESEATGPLVEMYDQARTPHGTVDNVMKVHSLRPHTMQGHVALYRSVLHHPDITLPLWFLEVVASYTSIKNNCAYSLAHHFHNARELIADDERADRIYGALSDGKPEEQFSGKELALLRYADKLTLCVGEMKKSDAEALRNAGCDDGEILEVNQVVAYFNYSNRLLNGLGVTTEGDAVGYY
tara:strand:+ start:7326 stop:7895 length:570 start_codon:yes stop_codon:yes gene_type:complete